MAPKETPTDRLQYVFGYGSLLERADRAAAGDRRAMCHLRGYRRLWNVAMNNAVDLCDYKYYVETGTDVRPRVFVAFLNIVPAGGARVNGTLVEVSSADLAELDGRERNYARVDVSPGIDADVNGIVWAYTGTRAARQRFALGMRTGRAVISEEYYQRVRQAFAAVEERGLAEFDELTEPPPCPVAALRRRELAALPWRAGAA
jgi:cation transport regulator ChaC